MEYLFNKNEFNRTVRRKRYKKVYRTLYTSIPVFPYLVYKERRGFTH